MTTEMKFFVREVAKMRKAQKRYFAVRKEHPTRKDIWAPALGTAKSAEAGVDEILETLVADIAAQSAEKSQITLDVADVEQEEEDA